MSKIAIVTGGSSGIGRCVSANLLESGCRVYEFSRRDNAAPGVVHISCDITDERQVRQAVDEVASREGRIDILVNNAGFGISGAAETTQSAASHRQLEVNLFGADNAVRAVLPYMRQQRHGRILFMSSIAGIIPIPFQLWYSVSKSAILSYSLALQNEIRPFGITVCAIMPGDISSGFTDARMKSEVGDDAYSGRIQRSVAVMEHDERNGMTPEYAAKVIAKYALKEKSRPMVALGLSYKGAAALAKLLPRGLSNRIVGSIYAK
ncbi:MAG: SDR family NAD(P)-dependent oxidoreductase [Oscillospiraceae bacterium]|nr:SDR family NAD(P)-dependent oxidoreductase [Oscillospiraceae bacterium]